MPRAFAIALALGLIPGGDVPRAAWVVAESVDVLDEPDDAAFSTGRLARGRRVTVRRDGPEGWLTIDPPDGSFSLMDEGDLEDLGDGRARVLPRFAAVHAGRAGSKRPGPARVTLRQGAIVRLLDRRPIVERRGAQVRTWVAIAPPPREVRFVRADALDDLPDNGAEEDVPGRDRLARHRRAMEEDGSPRPPRPPALGQIDPEFFEVGPPTDPDVSPPVADRLRSLGDRQRSELRKPIDTWDLEPIEAAYRDLARRAGSDADRRALKDRLARLERQKRAASAARSIQAMLRKSRERDARIAVGRASAEEAAASDPGTYDASGLLQTSSKMSDGRRVHVLLGDDGGIVCYLLLPPGLEPKPLLGHRVGVRGTGRFDEDLRERVIAVQDVERLDLREEKPPTSLRPR